MKKKIIGVVSALALVAILAACLVACNPYKWDGIGGGDASAPVKSNGGYVVRQGDYLYYINGYAGTGGEGNEWGTPVKQSIVRSKIITDGTVETVDLKSTKVVVPKIIYNTSAKGGFAIYGEWIYYATPNNDRDKNGTASTTDTDFMRTKIDASVTQRLGKINVRNAEYLFTPTRVLYYTSNTIRYIDFTGMKTNKNIDNAKGASEGVLAENVSSIAWSMDCDTVFYTQTVTGDDSYKNYNELCSIKVDGSDRKTLATQKTFVTEGKEPEEDVTNVFKYTLRDMCVEESDKTVTLYYTKTYYLNETDTAAGLFCTKAEDFKNKEKKLNSLSSTTLYPLGYEDGALAYNGSSLYCWYNGKEGVAENPVQGADASKTIWKVDAKEGLLYMTASSSATDLLVVSYKTPGNVKTIMTEGIKVDWLKLDFVDDNFYFFATDDSNFMHYINVDKFDNNAVDEDGKRIGSTYIGFEKEEDESKSE